MTEGASKRWSMARRRHRFATDVALAAVIGLLAGGATACSDREPSSSEPVADRDHWALAHLDDLDELDGSIGGIIGAVEGNDVRLFSDSPRRCADSAGSLAGAAAEEGDTVSSDRLARLASLCEWLIGPADAHDPDGVMLTLDPLFIAVGQVTPLLELIDDVS